MYGRFRYWCGGREVGNFKLVTSLRDVLFMLEGMRRDIGKRQNPRFWQMSPTDMFRLVDGGLFGQRDIAPLELSIEEQWARHNISPPVDVFDDWKLFLVEDATKGRIVFSQSPYSEVREVAVSAGEVDTVLESTRVALEDVYNRETGALQKP